MNSDDGTKPPSRADDVVVSPTDPVGAPAPAPVQDVAPPPVVAQPQPPAGATDDWPEQPEGYEVADDDTEETEEEWLARNFTTVTWTAQEFIQHDKTKRWYVKMAAAFLAVAVVAYLLTRDIFSSGTIVVVGVMLMYLGGRKPKMLNYSISGKGLEIGANHYDFEQFRSYAVMQENGQTTAALYPLQRFMPLITLYFSAKDAERATTALAEHLPMEEREHDMLDRLLHRIKL